MLALLIGGGVGAANAVDVYAFDGDQQRLRYQALIDEFRCPKCMNTNLAGSDAPIAQDLRRTVHRLVVLEGKTDQEVQDYLLARYGEFVLYDPPMSGRTLWIWLAPLAVALFGGGVLLVLWRNQKRTPAIAVSADEQARIDAFLGAQAPDAAQPQRNAQASDP